MCAARRRWSQHWLANDELAEALVRDIDPQENDRFLEIGPGRGRLTMALLARPVEIVAVEIDQRCCAHLRKLDSADRLQVIHGDILELDPDDLPWRRGIRLVGNLPYAIASPILEWTVRHRPRFADAHFMLPAAVARRVLAKPGGRDYGVLSVRVQWAFRGEVLRTLGPGAFRPPPEIDSAFVVLRPRPESLVAADDDHAATVLKAAFAHRRKTLANNLARGGWSTEEIRNARRLLDLEGPVRAEDLSPGEFARLARSLPPP